MSTAVAKKDENALARQTIKETLDKCKKQLIASIGRNAMTADRVMQTVLMQCYKVPKLYQCSPMTIAGCMLQAAQLGLEIGGALGQAYMIPYWNSQKKQMEANFQVGYKGLVNLVHRCQTVRISCNTVWSTDFFREELGTDKRLEHKIVDYQNRGERVGCYATIAFVNGIKDHFYWTMERVEEHRKRFSKSVDKQGNPTGPWANYPDREWMEWKTVLIQLLKTYPVSTELSRAVALSEMEGDDDQGMDALVEGIEPPSRVGQTAARLGAKGEPVDLDKQIMESLKESGTDWDRFWKEHGGTILNNDSGLFMSLGELTEEDKVQVLEILK